MSPKIYYIFDKIAVLSIICNIYDDKNGRISKEDKSIEILIRLKIRITVN